MRIRAQFCGAFLAAVALPAAAQDFTGKWGATAETQQGAMQLVFNFMVEGEELSGTVSNDFTGETPIADGVVDGNKITFNTTFDSDFGAMTISYAGALEDDAITLTIGFDGAPDGGGMPPLTLTRAEDE